MKNQFPRARCCCSYELHDHFIITANSGQRSTLQLSPGWISHTLGQVLSSWWTLIAEHVKSQAAAAFPLAIDQQDHRFPFAQIGIITPTCGNGQVIKMLTLLFCHHSSNYTIQLGTLYLD